MAWDVTEIRLAEQQRKNDMRELVRSNVDLERFAHVASHDLKEPLRNVCALSDLLARQSGNKLDEDEREVLLQQAAQRLLAGARLDERRVQVAEHRVERAQVPLVVVDEEDADGVRRLGRGAVREGAPGNRFRIH